MSPNSTQELPTWTRELLAADGICPSRAAWRRLDVLAGSGTAERFDVARRDAVGGGHRLLSYRLQGAVRLEADAFQSACRDIYRQMAEDLGRGEASHPIRLWNFIPQILEPLGELEHRYMVFNAGRFEALSAWLGGEDGIDRQVATASGVGHPGDDLHVHCLAAEIAGEPVENPRQIAAYRYSARYGPKPPCFARATRYQPADAEPWLLVGGTASVVGEDSLHDQRLDRQLQETLANLAAVAHAGGAVDVDAEDDDELVTKLLARYRHLRVYFVRDEDRDWLERTLSGRIARGTEVELVPADLCRPELLVEIEGVADLAASPGARSAALSLARVAIG